MPQKVAIIGLGQIGSSLALALKGLSIIGVDRDRAVLRKAARVVDEVSSDLAAVKKTDIVVLAMPVREIIKTLPRLAGLRALIMDVGSTKGEIIRVANRHRLNFVGGHPIAGTEKAGFEAGNPKLFAGKPFILIPSKWVDKSAIKTAREFVQSLGARPVFMDDAGEHDKIIAVTIHLPHLVAYALAKTAVAEKLMPELVGNSFKDTTRVAASDVDMVLDFLMTNRGNLSRVARKFLAITNNFVDCLTKGDEMKLRDLMSSASRLRRKI